MALSKAQLEALLRSQLDAKYGAQQSAVRTQYDNQLALLGGEGAAADAAYTRAAQAAQQKKEADLRSLLAAYEQDALRRGMARSTYALERRDQGRAALEGSLDQTLAGAALTRDAHRQAADQKAAQYAFARDSALAALAQTRADEQAAKLMELLLQLEESSGGGSGGSRSVTLFENPAKPKAAKSPAPGAGGGGMHRLMR